MKKARILAWSLAAVVIILTFVQVVRLVLNAGPNLNILDMARDYMFALVLPAFAVVAALIISRQPGNIIGWLMFLPTLLVIPDVLGNIDLYLQSFTTAPDPLPLRLWLSAYYTGTSWLVLIFPLFFIPVLFPTGRPPSSRWRWLIYAGLVMCGIFLFIFAFVTQIDLQDFVGYDLSLINPIGFLGPKVMEVFIPLWGIGLLSMTILSFSSLFIRYRGASLLEREQIKWLLFAVAIFGILYIASLPANMSGSDSVINKIGNLLWELSLLGIPISIGIAILRYRLWDIDVIIRRTLIYGALTFTLAVVFFGTVTLLQAIFSAVSGQQSAVATVISTLLIAALFTPLRRRIQNDIDRRFFRQKYNAQQAVERFAAAARDETDLDQLTAELLAVVSETMQPNTVSIWLEPPPRRNASRDG